MADEAMDDGLKPVTVPLRAPIEDADGNKLAALTFRPANVGDAIETASIENPTAQEALLYARMAGQPIETFRKVSRIDMATIKERAGPLSGAEGDDLAALASILGIDGLAAMGHGAQPND